MVSAGQVEIYIKFDGDIDRYQRRGSPQRAFLGDTWKKLRTLGDAYFWLRRAGPPLPLLTRQNLTFLLGLWMKMHADASAPWLKTTSRRTQSRRSSRRPRELWR